MKDILNRLQDFGDVNTNVPFSKLTTLGIGGNAQYVVYPKSISGLRSLMKVLKEENIPFKVIGKGSNLLCSDDDFNGVVIRLDKNLNDVYFVENKCFVEAGCSLIGLSKKAMEEGLTGLEFAGGIPATVGGAIYQNAGAYLSNMAAVIEEVLVLCDDHFEWMSNEECKFAYRHSVFYDHSDWIIVGAKMCLAYGDRDEIFEKMNSRRAKRCECQPLDKRSAGSIFKNPEDVAAWKLIDGIGYRGKMIGGAMVSDKHCNFLVNENHATAKDFIQLVTEIETNVKDKYGIELHMEVEKFNWQ